MVLTSATSGPTVKASPLKLAPNRRQQRWDRLVMRNPSMPAVTSRVLIRRTPARGMAAIEENKRGPGRAISAGRIAVRRAISVPLTPLTRSLSRSLTDTPPRRSGSVAGPRDRRL
jgi:hypothetical protein